MQPPPARLQGVQTELVNAVQLYTSGLNDWQSAIVAQKLQVRTLATQGTNETLAIRNELRSDLFRERGFERLIAWTEYPLRDGLIASQSIQFDLTDPASAAYFAEWGPPARTNAP